jgi:hypothetical protein
MQYTPAPLTLGLIPAFNILAVSRSSAMCTRVGMMKIAAIVERICEEAELVFQLLHLHATDDYCFTVER